MANITDVKLPDNSQYDLKDNVSGYAKKVAGATTDDLASLTATGDLADSGKKLSDLVLKADVKDVLNSTSTTDPLSAKQGKILADNLAANENVYGAKNQLPYPYFQTTKTENDITFTDVGDGTITVSGVANAGVTFYLTNNYTGTPIKQGVYKVNGCPINGGATSYRTTIEVYDEYGQTVSTHYDDGAGVEISVADNQSLHLSINVYSGVDLSTPITFKPMIRDARIIDPTFAPYAMTNRELTENKVDSKDVITTTTNFIFPPAVVTPLFTASNGAVWIKFFVPIDKTIQISQILVNNSDTDVQNDFTVDTNTHGTFQAHTWDSATYANKVVEVTYTY